MIVNYIKKLRFLNNYPSLLLLIFILAFMIMIARNMFINNPYIMGDEYIYKELSHRFFDRSELVRVPILSQQSDLPNVLYFRLFHLTRYFQESFFEAAQILNSLFFCLALFPIYGVARIFVKPQLALFIGVCALVSPYSAHTAYFTPESMYYFVFWVFAYSFLSLIGHRPGTAGLVGGVILGLLYLIKPHALATLVATNLVLITLYLTRSRSALKIATIARAVLLLNLGFWLSMLSFRYFLSGELFASIFGQYEVAVRDMVHLPALAEIGRSSFFVVIGHLAFVSVLYFLPVTVVLFGLITLGQADPLRMQRAGLGLLGVSVFLLHLAMSVRLTVFMSGFSGSELLRLHGRYYNFVLPLLLIGFYAFFDQVRSLAPQKARYFSSINLAGGIWLIFAYQFIMPGRRLGALGFPDVAWLVYPYPTVLSVGIVLAVIVLLYFSFAKKPRAWVFSVFFVSLSLLGSVLNWQAQNGNSRRIDDFTRAAKAVENLLVLSERDLDSGIVFAPNQFPADYFLFPFDGLPLVKELTPGTVIEADLIPPETTWIVLFGDYDLKVPYVSFIIQGRTIRDYKFSFGLLKSCLAAGPANYPLATVDGSLAGMVGIDPQLQTAPWGLENNGSDSWLWLGRGESEGLAGTLWSDEKQLIRLTFDVASGPARGDSLRTVELTLENEAGTKTERQQFDQATALNFGVELQEGYNEFRFKSLDQATVLTQPDGDTRPLLVLLHHITVASLTDGSQAGPDNYPLVTVDPSLAGAVGIDPHLKTPWPIEIYEEQSLSFLWLGHGEAGGMAGALWSDAARQVVLEFEVSPGPSREDQQRTVQLVIQSNGQATTQEKTFDGGPVVLVFPVQLQPGRNDFQFTVIDEATIPVHGDTRPLLVFLRHITVKPSSGLR